MAIEHLATTTVDAPLSDSAIRESLTASVDLGAWIERFESIYREARGDVSRIPWAHQTSCPCLESWLNAEAPSLVRPGGRVAVVGCGLGHDAVSLAQRGYDVSAFDICHAAVESAKRAHPECSGAFFQADLLDLPSRLFHRFDLVVEVHTLQSLPPVLRQDLASGMARLLSHRGVLVAIARGRKEHVPLESIDGPPFSFTPSELVETFTSVGLEPVRAMDDFTDDNSPPVRRLRACFRRAASR